MEACANSTGNNTSGNNITTENPEQFEPYTYTANVVILMVVVTAMLIKLLGCICLFFCTQLVYPIRYVSLSFMVGMLAFDVGFTILQVTVLIYGVTHAVTQELRAILSCISITVIWSSLAHLAINRLAFVTKDANYWIFNSKKKVMLAIVVFDWALPIVMGSGAIGYAFDICTFSRQYAIENTISVLVRRLMMIPFVVYNGIAVFTHVALRRFLRNSEDRRPTDTARYSSAQGFISVTIASFLLQTPFFLFALTFGVIDLSLRWYPLIKGLTALVVFVSMIVNTLLCIWKVHECRYHFFRLFLSCFENYRNEADRLRLQVYNTNTAMNV